MQKLLKYQDERGLFPTIGLKESSTRLLDSVLLHTFVLEYLLDHHPEEEPGAIQKGIDFLVSQAIDEKGIYVWQWLKNPQNEEDYRHPDTDDTMRARLVIEKALQRKFSVPEEFKHFDYEAFLRPLMADDGSIRTYVRGCHSGRCPITNTNILYALTSIGGHEEIRHRIKGYLEGVADHDSFGPEIFMEKSRYYTSLLFPIYVLSKTIVTDSDLFSAEEKQRVLECARRVTPKNTLERAWQSSILRNFGQEGSSTELSFDLIPIFRSRKLGESYCSNTATGVFCLESDRL